MPWPATRIRWSRDETRLHLRDCLDHVVAIIDLTETYREMCSDLRDYYLAMVSNRMNEIMKVLTVIATLFMPLTFIAGAVRHELLARRTRRGTCRSCGGTFGYPFAAGADGRGSRGDALLLPAEGLALLVAAR